MANVKDSELILCQGIKMDKNYDNVLSYSTADLVTLCRANKIAESLNYSILDPTVNKIQVPIDYSLCIYANYIAFKNPHYGNKWYFAFVDDVIFESPGTTTIEFKVDVFSTWYSSFNVGKAFIEREHVSDDAFGKHTVPENLDVGEFVINGYDTFDQYANDYLIVVGCTKLPNEIWANYLATADTPTNVYNGTFSGLYYITFQTPKDATMFLVAMDSDGIADAVYSVFMIPKSIVTFTSWNTHTVCNISFTLGGTSFSTTYDIYYHLIPNSAIQANMATNVTITRNTTLNGYTPKNNKMFTSEFNYMYVTNNNGGDAKYNYEDFYNNSPTFNLVGAVCPGCSIRLVPQNYKNFDQGGQTNICNPYGLVGGKYPTCSWSSDSYTNWLTQQSVNISLDSIGTVASTLIASSVNPAMAVIGGLGLIQDAIKQNKQQEVIPPQAKGNTNSGDVTWAMGYNQFILYKMSCRYEYAKICDDYLSRFGYKVNEIKTPNLLSRTKFNYIKVGGTDELISGNIPARDLEEINAIFRKGTTIFHDYTTFGDYTQTNAIRTNP